MFSAINIGLSGMQAYSKGLQIISNNVTNLNTPGYKAATTSFSDMFNSGAGGMSFSSGGQSGNGVRIGPSEMNFTQGTLQQTSGDLDLAIDGRGFLVLLDGDKSFYARTGQFFVDQDGFLTEQGTTLRLAVLDASGRPTSLNLASKRTNAPVATTKITFADNLSSAATAATVPDVKVFDSSGAAHTWQVKLTPDAANPGHWTVSATDETGATVGTSTISFTGSVIDAATAQVTFTTNPTGAAPLSVKLDFSSVTSFSTGTTSTLRSSSVDGNAVGALSTVTIDENGKVKLTYTNGQTELEGAVALADFFDPGELKRVGGGLYENTGVAAHRVLSSGVDGLGKLVSKQIEGSNVDLSQEFGQLILIQRGFQASSQVVSVANDMIQQLFGIRAQG